MLLTGSQLQQIHEALLAAFNEPELHQLCAFELGADLDHVIAPGSLSDRVFQLIEWAKRSDSLPKLIAGAVRQQPTSMALRTLAADATAWPVCAQAGDRMFIADKTAPREIEEAYLARVINEHKQWLERYTRLAGEAVVNEESPGAELQLGEPSLEALFEKYRVGSRDPERRTERVPVDDLREAVANYRRLVILGEPGSGKTTTLKRLAFDYAAAAQADANAPIPVFVPLGEYSGPEPALLFAARYAGALALNLPAYLDSGRAILLLDAMNEMPRDGYKERVGRIQALIERFAQSAVAVSCRALDYDEELRLEKLEVRPLDVFRQRQYLHRYLGLAKGDELLGLLAGGDAVPELLDHWDKLETASKKFWGRLPTSLLLWLGMKPQGMTFEQYWAIKGFPSGVEWAFSRDQLGAWNAAQMGGTPPLLTLCGNPLIFVMLIGVYNSSGELPPNRGKLFGDFVSTLLEREQKRHPDRWPGAELLIAALSTLALAMQESGERGTSVPGEWAEEQLRERHYDADNVLYLGASATLLDVSGGQVRFVHQLIQEYFAAVAWQRRMDRGEGFRQYWPGGWVTPSGWEETAVLLAGILPDMTPLLEFLINVNPPLAARCIAECGGVQPPKELVARVQASLVDITTSLAVPVRERVVAGNALNHLGDPREGVGVKDGIPDVSWCIVPEGTFLMGEAKETDPLARESEAPQQIVRLNEFAISKYPITNAQYERFIADGGYTEKWRKCWTDAGWKWSKQHSKKRWLTGGDFDLPNHPVVNVSWYEAVAFCRWLTVKMGRPVMLPSEAQWEKSARGTDGRRYPWASELTPEHANYIDTNIDATSPVGSFPKGESPYHLLDVAGNVFEWTTTKWPASYKNYQPDDELDGDMPRVMRGGAWYYNGAGVRCSLREFFRAGSRHLSVGFRVASPNG